MSKFTQKYIRIFIHSKQWYSSHTVVELGPGTWDILAVIWQQQDLNHQWKIKSSLLYNIWYPGSYSLSGHLVCAVGTMKTGDGEAQIMTEFLHSLHWTCWQPGRRLIGSDFLFFQKPSFLPSATWCKNLHMAKIILAFFSFYQQQFKKKPYFTHLWNQQIWQEKSTSLVFC